MTLSQRVMFELELEALAKLHGYDLVEPQRLDGSGKTGTALVTIYEKDTGSPTEEFIIHLKPRLK